MDAAQQAVSLSQMLQQAAARLIAGGADRDALAVAFADMAVKIALTGMTASEVQDWLRQVADSLPENIAQGRPTH